MSSHRRQMQDPRSLAGWRIPSLLFLVVSISSLVCLLFVYPRTCCNHHHHRHHRGRCCPEFLPVPFPSLSKSVLYSSPEWTAAPMLQTHEAAFSSTVDGDASPHNDEASLLYSPEADSLTSFVHLMNSPPSFFCTGFPAPYLREYYSTATVCSSFFQASLFPLSSSSVSAGFLFHKGSTAINITASRVGLVARALSRRFKNARAFLFADAAVTQSFSDVPSSPLLNGTLGATTQVNFSTTAAETAWGINAKISSTVQSVVFVPGVNQLFIGAENFVIGWSLQSKTEGLVIGNSNAPSGTFCNLDSERNESMRNANTTKPPSSPYLTLNSTLSDIEQLVIDQRTSTLFVAERAPGSRITQAPVSAAMLALQSSAAFFDPSKFFPPTQNYMNVLAGSYCNASHGTTTPGQHQRSQIAAPRSVAIDHDTGVVYFAQEIFVAAARIWTTQSNAPSTDATSLSSASSANSSPPSSSDEWVIEDFFANSSRRGSATDSFNLDPIQRRAATSRNIQRIAMNTNRSLMFVTEWDLHLVRKIDMTSGVATPVVHPPSLNSVPFPPPTCDPTCSAGSGAVHSPRALVYFHRPAIPWEEQTEGEFLYVADGLAAALFRVDLRTHEMIQLRFDGFESSSRGPFTSFFPRTSTMNDFAVSDTHLFIASARGLFALTIAKVKTMQPPAVTPAPVFSVPTKESLDDKVGSFFELNMSIPMLADPTSLLGQISAVAFDTEDNTLYVSNTARVAAWSPTTKQATYVLGSSDPDALLCSPLNDTVAFTHSMSTVSGIAVGFTSAAAGHSSSGSSSSTPSSAKAGIAEKDSSSGSGPENGRLVKHKQLFVAGVAPASRVIAADVQYVGDGLRVPFTSPSSAAYPVSTSTKSTGFPAALRPGPRDLVQVAVGRACAYQESRMHAGQNANQKISPPESVAVNPSTGEILFTQSWFVAAAPPTTDGAGWLPPHPTPLPELAGSSSVGADAQRWPVAGPVISTEGSSFTDSNPGFDPDRKLAVFFGQSIAPGSFSDLWNLHEIPRGNTTTRGVGQITFDRVGSKVFIAERDFNMIRQVTLSTGMARPVLHASTLGAVWPPMNCSAECDADAGPIVSPKALAYHFDQKTGVESLFVSSDVIASLFRLDLMTSKVTRVGPEWADKAPFAPVAPHVEAIMNLAASDTHLFIATQRAVLVLTVAKIPTETPSATTTQNRTETANSSRGVTQTPSLSASASLAAVLAPDSSSNGIVQSSDVSSNKPSSSSVVAFGSTSSSSTSSGGSGASQSTEKGSTVSGGSQASTAVSPSQASRSSSSSSSTTSASVVSSAVGQGSSNSGPRISASGSASVSSSSPTSPSSSHDSNARSTKKSSVSSSSSRGAPLLVSGSGGKSSSSTSSLSGDAISANISVAAAAPFVPEVVGEGVRTSSEFLSAAAAFVGAVSFGPAAASSIGRAEAIVLLADHCGRGLDLEYEKLPSIVSLMGLRIGDDKGAYLRGAVVGNMLLLLLLGSGVGFATVVVKLVKIRGTFTEAAALLRCPSIIVVPCGFFLIGVVFPAVAAVVVAGQPAVDWLVAAFAVLVVGGLTAYFGFVQFVSHALNAMEYVRIHAAPIPPESRSSSRVLLLLRRSWRFIWADVGLWHPKAHQLHPLDEHKARMHAFIFESYRGVVIRHWLVADLAATALVSIAAGLIPASCVASAWLVAVVQMAVFIAFIVVRPFTARVFVALVGVFNGLLAAASVLLAIALHMGGGKPSPGSDKAMIDLAAVLSVAAMWVMVVSMIISVIRTCLQKFGGDEASAKRRTALFADDLEAHLRGNAEFTTVRDTGEVEVELLGRTGLVANDSQDQSSLDTPLPIVPQMSSAGMKGPNNSNANNNTSASVPPSRRGNGPGLAAPARLGLGARELQEARKLTSDFSDDDFAEDDDKNMVDVLLGTKRHSATAAGVTANRGVDVSVNPLLDEVLNGHDHAPVVGHHSHTGGSGRPAAGSHAPHSGGEQQQPQLNSPILSSLNGDSFFFSDDDDMDDL